MDDTRDWGMDITDWVKLCNIDFVKRLNNPEALLRFKRLAYFQRQGSNAIKALENIRNAMGKIEAFAFSGLKRLT